MGIGELISFSFMTKPIYLEVNNPGILPNVFRGLEVLKNKSKGLKCERLSSEGPISTISPPKISNPPISTSPPYLNPSIQTQPPSANLCLVRKVKLVVLFGET